MYKEGRDDENDKSQSMKRMCKNNTIDHVL